MSDKIMKNRKVEIRVSCPDDVTVNPGIFPKKHYEMEYSRIFHDAVVRLAVDRELTVTDFRVLLGVLGHLDYDNFLNMPQKALGDVLGIKQQGISKSLNKLVEKGCLEITGQIGRQNIYRMNPHLVHRGRGKGHKKLCKNWSEAS